MAYRDRTDPRARATAIIGVGTAHAALAAALVLGLAVNFEPQEEERIIGYDFPDVPPPPPPDPQPSQSAQPAERNPVAPTPPMPLPSNSSVTVEPFRDDAIVPDLPRLPDETRVVLPTPSPSANFAPRLAVPHGSPASWISNDDYPARALRNEDEGLARYRLVIATTGKVTACEITASSGSNELDRETCRLLTRRAQFEPASDASGAKVVGTYSGSVRWQIPD